MSKHKYPGLYFDSKTGKGEIDKRVRGQRVRLRFTASSREEAERIYLQSVCAKTDRLALQQGRTFREAALKYVSEANKRSIERDIRALEIWFRVMGDLPLERIHDGTVQTFVSARKQSGARSATITREIAVIARILKLAARVWRDEADRPWLSNNPLLQRPNWRDARKPYPLSWDEQRRLFAELPAHLAEMALFAVNTGCRESIVTGLRWDWEVKVPELGTSVFLVPGEMTKNGTEQLIVLNDIARRVIDARRNDRVCDYVFHRSGHRIARLHSQSWNKAWERAGLPGKDSGYLRGVHNLRHLFARRLRAVGVRQETIRDLLHHHSANVTERYSKAGLQELIDAVQMLLQVENVTMLRVVG